MSGIGPAMDAVMDDQPAVTPAATQPRAKDTVAPATASSSGSKASQTDANAKSTPASASAVVADATQTAPPAAAVQPTHTPTAAPVAAAAADTTSVAAAPASPITSIQAPATKNPATTQVPARPAIGEAPTPAGSLGGTVFALLLVIGLILALGWMAKRMPGFGRGAGNNGLRLVASLPIGARERVVVVEVGQTQLLLGVGPGGTRTLHTLTEPLPEADAAATPQFAQLLAQHFGKKA
ncbi:MAG: Flagellar biosynthesis protein FliO [uncultured Lysobacter sp.]|uniref:Flagellar protein n=1 Tax=uncultured Lysobacter sp. TaxID=271060 RepID=A0A6J4M477_9GAMM|nr:MAG: Flagellar biosynthesis protein FliO [uncultured Lysobacter sp.]